MYKINNIVLITQRVEVEPFSSSLNLDDCKMSTLRFCRRWLLPFFPVPTRCEFCYTYVFWLLMLLRLFFSISQQQCSVPYRGQGEQGSSPRLPLLQS